MDEENKEKIKKIVIVSIILFVVLGILTLILKSNKESNKVLNIQDYIVEKETNYSNTKGLMPIINLKGKEIENINNEIMNKYYSVAYNEFDEFEYEYTIYKDILSILVTITYATDSEYGNIEYYTYNINIKKNKVLTNEELYKYLDIKKEQIKDKIDLKYQDFYKKDQLKADLSYKEYLKIINYKEENNRFVIKENSLYNYNVITLTQDLINYPGNINEIKLISLK